MSQKLYQLLSCFPGLFWNLKTKSFIKEPWQNKIFPQHKWLFQTIKQRKISSILEVGCGFGRNLDYLISHNLNPNQLTGTDISRAMLDQARLKLKNQPVTLIKAKATKLPFAPDSFDLVFTHGLLMHLRPKQAATAIKELTRLSRSWIIIIEETKPKPGKLNYFTWVHDYEKIIADVGLTIKNQQKKPNSIICYLLKKPSTISATSNLKA